MLPTQVRYRRHGGGRRMRFVIFAASRRRGGVRLRAVVEKKALRRRESAGRRARAFCLMHQDKHEILFRSSVPNGRHAPTFLAMDSIGTWGPESSHKERRENALPYPTQSSLPS